MEKILGLDLGTNSLGWAVIEKDDNEYKLEDHGVRIFQEGVKIEKGIENSRAAERTAYRSARRMKYRRKLRKINTLKVLSDLGFCPKISNEQLNLWRYKKIYPDNIEFRNWLKTDEASKINPYHYRALAVEKKFDKRQQQDRYILGRAFYHISQRRGFLSNRLDTTKENEGQVITSIEQLTSEMGDRTLGQLFYEYYLQGKKIRKQYTHREKHYQAEFFKICQFQEISKEVEKKLFNAIFYQRPLKSQRGNIGHCPFEPRKYRCSSSHPVFEEFRMLSFINNIKMKTPVDSRLRPLTTEEKQIIHQLFFRKSKPHFSFEEICKKITPKGNAYFHFRDKEKTGNDYLFNYKLNTTVSGCPTIAQIKDVFGEDYLTNIKNRYTSKDGTSKGKSSEDILHELWHILFTFNDNIKLMEFGRDRFLLDEEEQKRFSKIKLKRDYASLSMKALRKILPFLKDGHIYPHAVFMAKLEDILPEKIWQDTNHRDRINKEIFLIIQNQNAEKNKIDIVNGLIRECKNENVSWSNNEFWQDEIKKVLERKIHEAIDNDKWNRLSSKDKALYISSVYNLFKTKMKKNLGRGEFVQMKRTDESIKEFLFNEYGVSLTVLKMLYHPSAIEVYPEAKKDKNGIAYLGSPMISSIKNPMAMRSLHQLRKVVNELLEEEIIDSETRIHIEMARGLNDANHRKAIQRWQRDREKKREEYQTKIIQYFETDGMGYIEPSDSDILKYQLYEEQNHYCIYTGEQIAISEFIGEAPKYDIEHTIPRSLSYDNSQMNLTLCKNSYNREVKRNQIPSQLSNHSDILARIEHWHEKFEELDKQYHNAIRHSRSAADKETKDRMIQRKHYLALERDYWKNKYERFLMEDVPEGFKNSQLNDTRIITRYGRLYLKSVFDKVYTVKGSTVADFRKIWGLQDNYSKKERIDHIHHCIDAITIACMTKSSYENLAHYYHELKQWELSENELKPEFEKPWNTFTEDMKNIEQRTIISHYSPKNLGKQSRKVLRERGRIKKNREGDPIYLQGDTVRGSLHEDTYYGAIVQREVNIEGEEIDKLHYVVRRSVDANTASTRLIKPTEIDNIIDEVVRQKIKNAISEKGFNNAISEPIWMNEEKGIQIKKVRCKVPSVTNPIHLKLHRDLAVKEHKHHYHVVNDENYLMAIYEGENEKGKINRDFKLVNNLEAGQYFKTSSHMNRDVVSMVPDTHPTSGLPLRQVLRSGQMVILFENSVDELKNLDLEKLVRRIYKVVGFSSLIIKKKYSYGVISLRHQSEARPTSKLKLIGGEFIENEEFKTYRKLYHTQFKAALEGIDFNLSPTGRLKWILN